MHHASLTCTHNCMDKNKTQYSCLHVYCTWYSLTVHYVSSCTVRKWVLICPPFYQLKFLFKYLGDFWEEMQGLRRHTHFSAKKYRSIFNTNILESPYLKIYIFWHLQWLNMCFFSPNKEWTKFLYYIYIIYKKYLKSSESFYY